MEEESKSKWEGKAMVEVVGTGAEVAWAVLEDFCNIHKWISLDTCYQVDGILGQPGLIRYCASTVEEGVGAEKTTTIKWAKEKILAIDPVQRCLTYEVVENNMGFKSYVATLKVLPIEGDGCKIEWGFVSDPVEGWSCQEESKPKWEGKSVTELPGTDAEQVWTALEDFCNLHKWWPIETCYQLEGVPGQPGLIRYCASTVEEAVVGAQKTTTTIKWTKEKLLAIDPVQRCLSYEIVENNMGFKSYVATLKVLPMNGDGCKIDWGFVCDPVEGWSFQDLKLYLESSLQSMAKKIQLACSSTSTH
ncbi:Lachrymatory-factor synthase [Glycine soja]|uniref:Lachrymatory-factor synthase n=1 Tax=Glycine soja TaxID=3848 RepID=A0A445K6S8_GLYSO|nr:Lachrymatory-factor synthase [Glycine soja]